MIAAPDAFSGGTGFGLAAKILKLGCKRHLSTSCRLRFKKYDEADVSLPQCSCCFASGVELRRVCQQKSRRREITLGYKLISRSQLSGYVAFSVCTPARSLSDGRSVGSSLSRREITPAKWGRFFFTAPLMLQPKDEGSVLFQPPHLPHVRSRLGLVCPDSRQLQTNIFKSSFVSSQFDAVPVD